jgi:hypothetical protein
MDRSYYSSGSSERTLNFKITVFLLLVAAGTFILQEFALPSMYDNISYGEKLKMTGFKAAPGDTTGENFSMSEFSQTGSMKSRNNIAFSTGNSYIYFEKMFDGRGSYYVEGFSFISYNSNKELDFVITSDNAKIVSDLIYMVNPVYFDYYRGAVYTVKRINGIKKIVLAYRPAGIFALSSDAVPDTVSLVNVFLYSDFAFNSGVNFYRLGNIVFDRVSYYIILFLMMILASTFGAAFRNMRLVSRDYLQTAAFYAVSFFIVALVYDSLSQAVNLIYSFLV